MRVWLLYYSIEVFDTFRDYFSIGRPFLEMRQDRNVVWHVTKVHLEGCDGALLFLSPLETNKASLNLYPIRHRQCPSLPCLAPQIHPRARGDSRFMRTSSSPPPPLAPLPPSNAPRSFSARPLETRKMEALLPMLKRSSMLVANYCCPLLLFLS